MSSAYMLLDFIPRDHRGFIANVNVIQFCYILKIIAGIWKSINFYKLIIEFQ